MKNQKGFTLIEVLVAMAIIGLVVSGGMSALNDSSKAAIKSDQMDTARAIAISEIEYVKQQPFSASGYSPDSSVLSQHPGYTAAIASTPAQDRDSNIQRITVSVTYRDIYSGQMVTTTLQDFKVN